MSDHVALKNVLLTGDSISPADYARQFEAEWDLMTKRFFKFEARQFYDEGADPSFDAFVQGQQDRCAELLKEARNLDKPFYESALARGTSFGRVHSVKYPLTQYIQWELNSYKITQSFGEATYLIDEETVIKQFSLALPDFVLFDTSVLYLLEYNDRGILDNVLCCRDRQALHLISSVADILTQIAIPLDKFLEDCNGKSSSQPD